MLGLVVASQFGIQPILAGLKEQALPQRAMESVFRERFSVWHGVASALYVIESLLGVAAVLLQPPISGSGARAWAGEPAA